MKNGKIEITEQNYSEYRQLYDIRTGNFLSEGKRNWAAWSVIATFLLAMTLGANTSLIVLSAILLGGLSSFSLATIVPGLKEFRALKKEYPKLNTKIKRKDLEEQLEIVKQKERKKDRKNVLNYRLQESKHELDWMKEEEYKPAYLLENEKSLKEINKKLEKIEQKRDYLQIQKDYLKRMAKEEKKYKQKLQAYQTSNEDKDLVLGETSFALENKKTLKDINKKLKKIEQKMKPLDEARRYLESIEEKEEDYEKTLKEYQELTNEEEINSKSK